LSRAGQLSSFIDILDRIGAPTDPGLERARLPAAVLERPDTLVSTRAAAAFVGEMARREGITDFGWQAGRLGSLRLMSSGLTRRLRAAPTLLQALETVCDLAHGESSNVRFWLHGQDDAVLFCHRGSVEVEAPGQDELSLMRVGVALSILRLFTGPDWVPTDCALALAGGIGPVAREGLGGARIVRTPDYGWFRLPRSLLALPSRAPAPPAIGAAPEAPPPLDLESSLTQALRPYLAEGTPTIRHMADLAGTSVRSLQRDLTREGSSFRKVLERARLEVARDLLAQPDVRIVDVAHEAGFSDHAHFVRFFRRLAGVPPREYRATLTAR
jgi:AraC-like DNA-binding protein